MTRGALAIAAAAGGVAAVLCSCGDAPTATATSTATVVDGCVVGTWRTTSISGGITIAGVRTALTGGAGELLVISPSGAIRTDDRNTAPLTGSGSDGSAYTLTQTGTATGTVTAVSGHMTVTLDQPTPLTVSLYKNGVLLQSQHPGSATDSYTCAPASSLVITGAGGTVSTYAHA